MNHTDTDTGFDFEQDRDLIALINESRSDFELQTARDTARARLSRRAGSATGNQRTVRRALAAPLHSLARAIEGPSQAR